MLPWPPICKSPKSTHLQPFHSSIFTSEKWPKTSSSQAQPATCKSPQLQPYATAPKADTKTSGGSLLADFLSRESGPIKDSRIHVVVRSKEQAEHLSKLDGVSVIQLDLSDEAGVRDAVLKSKIDIVLHIASSMDIRLAENLINALGERKKNGGSETYFVQVCLAMTQTY